MFSQLLARQPSRLILGSKLLKGGGASSSSSLVVLSSASSSSASSTGFRPSSSLLNYKEANKNARPIKTTFELVDPTSVDKKKTFQLTKIVATIGPTSEQLEPLRGVVNAGMKVMRLNFSHATKDEVELRMKNLALCQVRMK